MDLLIIFKRLMTVPMGKHNLLYCIGCLAILLAAAPLLADDPAERGYRFLLNKPTIPPDFDQQSLEAAWKFWPEPLRTQAEQATPEQRREMTFSRYGLTPRPGDDSGKPLQYVVQDDGGWVMNCFSCHGGKVAGQVIPGLPNAHYAMQTLIEETRAAKVIQGKPLAGKDLASVIFPLGNSNGTTNAVMFGVALMNFRDADLNLVRNPVPAFTHHDMDAPPWWHFKKKQRLYIDGFAEKSPRALMQFMLVKENGPAHFRRLENDFRDVYAYLESLDAPKYPFEIDRTLAEKGRGVFENHCAQCHGTYGEKETYPEKLVPIDVVGTSRVRLDALSKKHREGYGESWFAHHGAETIVAEPGGYVAPPLDGIWASAPYLHNGSVPTLWHLMHSDQRPAIWKRTEDGYDQQRVGLEVKTFESMPAEVTTAIEKRTYFDTARFGKSSQGHTFPDELTETEKQAVLEYLKTL